MQTLHIPKPTQNEDLTSIIHSTVKTSTSWEGYATCRVCGKPIKSTGDGWFHDPNAIIAISRSKTIAL